MIDTEFDDNGISNRLAFLASGFLDRFATGLLMVQGRVVADKVRREATFRDGTGKGQGNLRRSITAIPLRDNKGIKVTSRHNGRYLPYASPMGMGIDIVPRNGNEFMTFQSRTGQWVKLRKFTYEPKLDIRGPFMEMFGRGRAFGEIERRMVERIEEMLQNN